MKKSKISGACIVLLILAYLVMAQGGNTNQEVNYDFSNTELQNKLNTDQSSVDSYMNYFFPGKVLNIQDDTTSLEYSQTSIKHPNGAEIFPDNYPDMTVFIATENGFIIKLPEGAKLGKADIPVDGEVEIDTQGSQVTMPDGSEIIGKVNYKEGRPYIKGKDSLAINGITYFPNVDTSIEFNHDTPPNEFMAENFLLDIGVSQNTIVIYPDKQIVRSDDIILFTTNGIGYTIVNDGGIVFNSESTGYGYEKLYVFGAGEIKESPSGFSDPSFIKIGDNFYLKGFDSSLDYSKPVIFPEITDGEQTIGDGKQTTNDGIPRVTEDLRANSLTKKEIKDYITKMAEKYKVPPELAISVGYAESGLSQIDPKTGKLLTDGRGSFGLFQLQKGTAKDMGVKDISDWRQNSEGGIKYLSKQIGKFGTYEKALAAYNWGPSNLNKKGYDNAPSGTKNYVQKVLARCGNACKKLS